MKILKEVIRKNIRVMAVFAVMVAANATIFALYDIITEPMIYAVILTFVVMAVIFVIDLISENRKRNRRMSVLSSVASEWRNLPDAESLAEEDYIEIIKALGELMEKVYDEESYDKQDMIDYYTAWVHQIKTPIAVMRFKLSDDTPEHHALLIELSRIEQYVEMVLQYIRIGSGTNDLVIREYDLDTLICESVRKFAPQFFEKKLQLIYEKTDATIVSDRKWFICILDQLLSNAVKYTSAGSVTISVKDSVLSVADTGIGIAPEDLPRIFEKGYTGTNGRIENRSSGLGLYLAKKAADLLSIRISAESVIGKGSTFILDLTQERVR